MQEETRKCIECQVTYPLNEQYFSRNQSTNTGGDKYYRTDCKSCNKKMKKGRDISYRNSGKPKYPDFGYNSIIKKTINGYPCDNCGKTDYSKRIVFDHDHNNLTQRGWLCDGCNRAIGMLGDDEHGLINSLSYIYGIKPNLREEYYKMISEVTKLFKQKN